jgi:hypothetical protein
LAKGGGGVVVVRFSNNFAAEIRALADQGGDAARESLVRALLDERPWVAREARYALARAFVLPRGRVLRLYTLVKQRHTRTQLLALLARGERGASMVSLLEAALVSDPAMMAQVCEHLRRWLAVWAPLPQRAVNQLAGAFRRAERVLPEALAERLRVYLRELHGARVAAPVRKERPRTRSQKASGGYLRGRTVRRSYELAPRWGAVVWAAVWY